MYCKKCGKEIQEEWMACPNCGAALNDTVGGNQTQYQESNHEGGDGDGKEP